LNIKDYLKKQKALIDAELLGLMPAAKEYPQVIHEAMHYSLKGGKRIRAILCLECCKAAGGKSKAALKAAGAVEMIHAYSLVHDDLPAMDNDDYRRGKPTCHRRFGHANAILTGDALLTQAFCTLSEVTSRPKVNLRIIKELARASGTFGMIGGQVVDLLPGDKDLPTLEYINIHKTGALISASCKIGAILAQTKERDINALFRLGEYLGIAFQMADDIIDGDGFAKMFGPKRAYDNAAELVKKAKGSVAYLGKKSRRLYEIADFILNRKY